MKINKLPSWEYLNECFRYDSINGELFWKVRPLEHFIDIGYMKRCNTRFSNKLSGYVTVDGYLRVGINGTIYPNHRIIWKLITKKDPPDLIDHIDGNRLNNKFTNLRKATNTENNRNTKKRKNNTSGFKGVTYYKRYNKYRAQIKYNNKNHFLGYFETSEEASKAYQEAALKFHQDFAKF